MISSLTQHAFVTKLITPTTSPPWGATPDNAGCNGSMPPLGCASPIIHLQHSNTISPKTVQANHFFPHGSGWYDIAAPKGSVHCSGLPLRQALEKLQMVTNCHRQSWFPAVQMLNMSRIWNQCSFNQFAICAISAFLLPQLDFFEKSQVVWVSCYSSGDDISVVRSFKKRSVCPTSSPRKLHLGRSTWGVSINNPGGKKRWRAGSHDSYIGCGIDSIL